MEKSNEKSRCRQCVLEGNTGICDRLDCHKPSVEVSKTESEEWENRYYEFLKENDFWVENREILKDFIRQELSSHSQKLVSELKEKIEENRCNIKFETENNKIIPRIEYEKEGVYLKYVDVVDIINNIKI